MLLLCVTVRTLGAAPTFWLQITPDCRITSPCRWTHFAGRTSWLFVCVPRCMEAASGWTAWTCQSDRTRRPAPCASPIGKDRGVFCWTNPSVSRVRHCMSECALVKKKQDHCTVYDLFFSVSQKRAAITKWWSIRVWEYPNKQVVRLPDNEIFAGFGQENIACEFANLWNT